MSQSHVSENNPHTRMDVVLEDTSHTTTTTTENPTIPITQTNTTGPLEAKKRKAISSRSNVWDHFIKKGGADDILEEGEAQVPIPVVNKLSGSRFVPSHPPLKGFGNSSAVNKLSGSRFVPSRPPLKGFGNSSAAKRRKMFKAKGPSINSEKNAPISDDHNLLKANDTGSKFSFKVAFTPIENNDPGEDTDTSLVTDLKLYNENNGPREDTDIDDLKLYSENNENNLLVTDLKLYNENNGPREDTDIDDSKAQTHVSVTEQLRAISNALREASLRVSTPLDLSRQVTVDPVLERKLRFEDINTPQTRNSRLKESLVHECLSFLNHADKEELMELKGIGEKRAADMIELRENSPEPFKKIDDLKSLGLTSKQKKVKEFKKHEARENIKAEFTSSGKDVTNDFEDVGHSNSAREMMDKYCIGDIVASSVPTKRAYVPPQQPHYNPDKSSDFIIKILQFLVPVMILG